MTPVSAAFWGVAAALVLGGLFLLIDYDMLEFQEPRSAQLNRPQVQTGSSRFGQVVSRNRGAVQPLDLVRFRTARSGRELTSRVVALAGQRVQIDEGRVLVDGAPLSDPYGRGQADEDWLPELVVPEGCVFVLTDQRWRGAERWDSRTLGPIPLEAIRYRFSPKEPVAADAGLEGR